MTATKGKWTVQSSVTPSLFETSGQMSSEQNPSEDMQMINGQRTVSVTENYKCHPTTGANTG